MVEQRTLNPSVVVRVHLPQLTCREVVVMATASFLFQDFAYLLRTE